MTDLRRYAFDLEVNPVPLARPRTSFIGGRARTFTPDREDFKNTFVWAVRKTRTRPRQPLDGTLHVTLQFWRHCTRGKGGDIDNLVKAVFDAGNGELWVDDRNIKSLRADVVAEGPDVDGRIRLIVRQLDPDRAQHAMAGTIARLGEARERVIPSGEVAMQAIADQQAAGMRELLADVDLDFDDPQTRVAILRATDVLLMNIEHLGCQLGGPQFPLTVFWQAALRMTLSYADPITSPEHTE